MISALILLATAQTAAAPPLWGNVQPEMTRAALDALYPAGGPIAHKRDAIEIDDVAITDRCRAEVHIRFNEAGIVRDVRVLGDPGYGGRCARDVMASLSAKYGQPANWDRTGGGLFQRGSTVSVWSRPDGVSMRFRDFERGGIAMASWELIYTKVDVDFQL